MKEVANVNHVPSLYNDRTICTCITRTSIAACVHLIGKKKIYSFLYLITSLPCVFIIIISVYST